MAALARPTLAQLVLVEAAAAAVLGGWALNFVGLVIGGAVALVLLILALFPLHRRWLYQVAGSWLGLQRRRRASAKRPGLAGLLGDYWIESISGGRAGADLGVVRSGTTWSLPLVLALDGVFNEDPPVPVDLLAGLTQIEDVPLSSVRLFMLTTPAGSAADAPAGPSAPMTQLAARYCVLTLDTRRAADAVAARGGSRAAVHQMLRRCAVHTEQVLSTAGIRVRRLDDTAVADLFGQWMGPGGAGGHGGPGAHRTHESSAAIEVGGTWSTIFAVTGTGPDVLTRVQRLVAAAPTPVAAVSLVLQPQAGGGVGATLLVRVTAPDDAAPRDAFSSMRLVAAGYDLVVQRVSGEQANLLRATTPLGVGEAA